MSHLIYANAAHVYVTVISKSLKASNDVKTSGGSGPTSTMEMVDHVSSHTFRNQQGGTQPQGHTIWKGKWTVRATCTQESHVSVLMNMVVQFYIELFRE